MIRSKSSSNIQEEIIEIKKVKRKENPIKIDSGLICPSFIIYPQEILVLKSKMPR